MERLEMAVSDLELALERSAKLPITDIALLQRRNMIKLCSLLHYTFCNPIARHLLEGKSLTYELEQGTQLRSLYIWSICSEERGVEAVLRYRYVDSTMVEKCFLLLMFVRLSESTNILRIASKGLQLLTSQFKLAAESAMGELAALPNLQAIVHSDANPLVSFREQYTKLTQHCRPDPACCKASRHGLCGSNIL
ncbi:hypothetical protein U9M48_021935 [Paspalum notatum var. saurae]|uniref:Uncharacterized protein n=1 Tax=Paspalum notatum var. saurae TaxID=547442 RepID=A0AAQ3THP6_PASNO